MSRSIGFAIVVLAAPVSAWCAGSGSNLVLKMAWAQKYRNRLSINAKVTILKLSNKETDADIHGGSRVNQVGLPMVAEILNGTQPSQQPARQQLNPATDGAEKSIYGAWRLWFEHRGTEEELSARPSAGKHLQYVRIRTSPAVRLPTRTTPLKSTPCSR